MTKLTTLTDASLALLRVVAAGGDLTARAIAERTGQTAKNIPRGLARLEAAGLIAGEPPRMTDGGAAVLALADGQTPATPGADGFAEVALDLIDQDPTLNPRKIFDGPELDSLAASIRDKGVAQPILLRQGLEPGRYRIVAGERRFRASQLAGKATIPAMIRQLTDDQALEIATIENIQRVNLSPLEEARAFTAIIAARMKADPDLALKEAKTIIADAVRKTVRYVEQRMDLLILPPILQTRLEVDPDKDGHLTLKEARAEVQTQRRKEREAKEKILEPADLLVMAEFFDATERYPLELAGWWYSDRKPVAVGHRALEEGEPVNRLIARGALMEYAGWKGDPRHFVFEGYGWSKKEIDRQLPGFLGKDRVRVLDALRIKVVGKGEADRIHATWIKPAEGARVEYASWFLNEPFISTPDPALEEKAEAYRVQEQEDAALAFDRRTQQLAREQADAAEREADRARIARDEGDYGRDLLAAVRDLEAQAPGLDHPAFTAAVATLMTRFDIPGPYALHAINDGRDCEIRDARDVNTTAAGYALEARRRLLVIAFNYASGFSAYSGPDLDLAWGRKAAPVSPEGDTQEHFVTIVAEMLLEDYGPLAAEDYDDEEDDRTKSAQALAMAQAGLGAYLAEQDIAFGDCEVDWSDRGAMLLAERIRVEGLGQTADFVRDAPRDDDDSDDEEGAGSEAAMPGPGPADDDAEIPDALRNLAGPGAQAQVAP